MVTEQFVLMSGDTEIEEFNFIPDLILIFFSPSFPNLDILKEYRKMYPDCIITGCSSSGEIEDISVHNNSIVITGVSFETSKVVYNEVYLPSHNDSKTAGIELIDKFDKEGLKHVYVLSEGVNVNGDNLVKGLSHQYSDVFAITGGLSGGTTLSVSDTLILTNDMKFVSNLVVGIGFYGEDLKVGYGALAGLNSLGVDRIITKSEDNIVYEIDDEPALDLLTRLLGSISDKHIDESIFIPLSVREDITNNPFIRTVIKANKIDGSITFTGNIPEGSIVRLMKSNIDRVVNAAEGAAEVSIEPIGNTHTDLTIVTSCAGRKNVLKELVEEEIQAVREVVGEDATITGFYAYGEISPYISGMKCELHNQTISITSISESDM